MISNRKARILLRVSVDPSSFDTWYWSSNRTLSSVNRSGMQCVVLKRRSRAQKRARALFIKHRDEDAAKWRALGWNVDLNQYTGRV